MRSVWDPIQVDLINISATVQDLLGEELDIATCSPALEDLRENFVWGRLLTRGAVGGVGVG